MNNEEQKNEKDTPVATATAATGKEANDELSKIIANAMLLLMAD